MPLPIRSLPIEKCRSLGPPPPPSACVGVFLGRRFSGRLWVLINGTARRHVRFYRIVLLLLFFMSPFGRAGRGSLVVERSLRVTALPWPIE